MGSVPGLGRFPHASEQLSPGTATPESALRSKRSHSNEKPTSAAQEQPPLAATREAVSSEDSGPPKRRRRRKREAYREEAVGRERKKALWGAGG